MKINYINFLRSHLLPWNFIPSTAKSSP
jgi:hypothetical protein